MWHATTTPLRVAVLFAAMTAAVPTPAGGAPAKPAASRPAKLDPQIRLFAPEPVRVMWPDMGPRVNAPPERRLLVPGQGLAIGVVAAGDGRDALLRGATLAFRIRRGDAVTAVPAQRAAALKGIKADNADPIIAVLGAAGVAEGSRREAEAAVSIASLAIVLPDWKAPTVTGRTAVVVEGEAVLASGEKVPLTAARADIDTWEAAAARPPFSNQEEAQTWMNGYALLPEPQHLPALIRLTAGARAHLLAVAGFPVFALEVAPPDAIPFIHESLAAADADARMLGALVLRWAGRDPAPLLASLSAEQRARVEGVPGRPDGYAFALTPEGMDATTQRMDFLWGEFTATGRARPIRAIVDLLALRKDYAVVAEAMKTPEVKKELTPAFVRGAVYMTAGWSLNSFARSSPAASDYVATWRDDPKVPAVIREELGKLFWNEAFRQPKEGK